MYKRHDENYESWNVQYTKENHELVVIVVKRAHVNEPVSRGQTGKKKDERESTMWSKCVEILFQTSKVVKKERGGGEGHEGETNYSTYATINFLWLEDKYILA